MTGLLGDFGLFGQFDRFIDGVYALFLGTLWGVVVGCYLRYDGDYYGTSQIPTRY